MSPQEAVGLAAAAKKQSDAAVMVLKALLDDLVQRELLTPQKRNTWLAKAGIK